MCIILAIELQDRWKCTGEGAENIYEGDGEIVRSVGRGNWEDLFPPCRGNENQGARTQSNWEKDWWNWENFLSMRVVLVWDSLSERVAESEKRTTLIRDFDVYLKKRDVQS